MKLTKYHITSCNSKKTKKIRNFYYCPQHIEQLNTCFCCCEKIYKFKYYCSAGNHKHTMCYICILKYLNNVYITRFYKKIQLNKCCFDDCSGSYNINELLLKNKYLTNHLRELSEAKNPNKFDKIVQETLTNNRVRICKKCKMKIVRQDACNTIKCDCGNVLCYSCGNNKKYGCKHCGETWTNEQTIERRAINTSYKQLIEKYGEEKKNDILNEIRKIYKDYEYCENNKKTIYVIIFVTIFIIILATLLIIIPNFNNIVSIDYNIIYNFFYDFSNIN